MSIFDSIKKTTEEIKEAIISGADEKASSTYGPNLISNVETFYGSGLMPKLKSSQYLRAAIGWVYGCVSVIADEVAGIDLKLSKYEKKNDETTEIYDHEALDILYRPNNAMTRFDLINLTFQYLELTGEAPWFVSFKKGKPVSVILLRPDRLTIKPGKNGELIGGYTYNVYADSGTTQIDLDPFEVVPLKYSDPDNPIRGKGPLQAAAVTYDLDNYAEKWNSQFFRNSASPSAALSTDKVLAKEVRARLQKKLEDNYRSIDNAHKTMILENGLKWQTISVSQKDMDFVEQQKYSRDKMLSIFRVPPTALGLTADVTRANAEATDYVFAKRTIRPKMCRFVEQLNEFFLPLFDNSEDLFFDFSDPVPQNTELLIRKADSGVQNGYMTVNEARESLGLDPIEGGDDLRDPTNFSNPLMAQDNTPIKGNRQMKKKANRYVRHLFKARTRTVEQAEMRKKIIQKVVQESVTPIILSLLKKKKLTASLPWNNGTAEQKKEAKWAFQDKQLNVAGQYEARVVKKLNSVFETQRDIMTHSIESGDRDSLDEKVETSRYLKALKPVMIEMMREQARLAFQILGIQAGFDEAMEKADEQGLTFLQRLSQYFEGRTFKFAVEVTRETNKKLGKTLAEGNELGESVAQMKKRITTLFGEMEGYRSERIARTETIRGSNFATLEAYKESDVVESKEWLATRDERTDEECAALDGKIISLDSNFQSKKQNGYEAIQYPPIHVNCRCTLLPVISR